jgi:hypothetical protein
VEVGPVWALPWREYVSTATRSLDHGCASRPISLAFGLPLLFALSSAALELTSLTQNVIVDTTGWLYAAGATDTSVFGSASTAYNTYESPPSSPSGVRPVLVGLGRGGRLPSRPFSVSPGRL